MGTGASSGFGLRIAIDVLSRGDRVIATGRSFSKLVSAVKGQIPGIQIDPSGSTSESRLHLLQLDVAVRTEEVKAQVDKAVGIWGELQVLVNNAGTGVPSLVEEGGYVL